MDELEERDNRAYETIVRRLERVEEGNLGNCEPVGGGVHELKIDSGPGCRVYSAKTGILWRYSVLAQRRARWSIYNA